MGFQPATWMKKLRRLPPRGVLAVVCGFTLHLSLGNIYTFGNLTTYLTSYMRVAQGMDVDYSQTFWIYTTLALCIGPFVLLGSLTYRRFGCLVTMSVGCVALTGATLISYLTAKASLVWIAVTYGALNGAGTGFVYSVPILVGYKWFPNFKGLVSGIIVGGFGLGGVVFTSIQTGYINPDNLAVDDDGFFYEHEVLDRVPYIFLIQGGAMTALQIIGIIGIREPKSEAKALAPSDELNTEQSVTNSGQITHESSEELSASGNTLTHPGKTQPWYYAFKKLVTWQILVGYCSNAMGSMTIDNFWKSFGQTFIKDDHFLAMVGALSAVFSLLGRIVWGLLCDRFRFKFAMLALSGLLAALLLSWHSTSHGGSVMFLIWVWAMFFSFAGTYAIGIVGTAEYLGQEATGPIYGVIFTASSVLTPIISPLLQFLLENYDYSVVFLFSGLLVVVGAIGTITIQESGKDCDDNVKQVTVE